MEDKQTVSTACAASAMPRNTEGEYVLTDEENIANLKFCNVVVISVCVTLRGTPHD